MSRAARNLIVFLAGAAIIAGALWYGKPGEVKEPQEAIGKYSDEALGISFEYRLEPEGYTLVEQEKLGGESEDLIQQISLYESDQYQGFLDSIESGEPWGESPPSISIFIYDNPDNLSAEEWAKTVRDAYLDMSVAPLAHATLAGLPAVTYTIDGLYRTETYVVGSKNKMYLIHNDFADPALEPNNDFKNILDSLIFL